MLTFRNTNIFFGTFLLTLLLLQVWFSIPAFIYLGLIAMYCLLLLYGSYNVGSNFFLKVLCSGNTSEKKIAISFDDGPARNYTPQVLQVLQEHGVPAAFFCIGKQIEENKTLFRQLHEQGHIIGNHSFTHTPMFDLLPAKKMQQDMQNADNVMKQVLGLQPKLFRPPYGVTTPSMKHAVQKQGYTTIGWNIRSLDTIARSEKKLLKKLIRLLQPGAVILLHDTQKITLSILPQFIKAARNEGYEFVRLDKLLNVEVYV
jgi:peptidoglycan/xylan/chitin deacetylase (PgdA/CDA1 family)